MAAALAGVGTPLSPPVLAADTSAGALQEVVVTARKREENLQDVPISIDVMTKQDLQNLGIAKFEDYVTKVPSLSFISVGPGLQTLYIRGVSDGSNPNYSNTSATGYFLDDTSLSWYGAQPDLHLYDVERIEVLNGPQGTTFGAGSMAGAVRFITVKPDVRAFSMGVDFDGAQIQDGRQNWTYEGYVNVPLIQGRLGLRLSGFAASKGGFIDNLLTTRTWKNGAISNNAEWARNDYNREHQDGGRIALKGILNERWSGDLTFTYQRQSFDGAWDQSVASRQVERFGPESRSAEAKIVNFHVDGDVGIGDLVFASTYWSLPTRQNNEYSQYMENVSYPTYNLPAGYKEGFACDTGPTKANPTQSYTGCNVPVQYYEYHTNPERWSNEVRLASKPGGRFHWLGGLYWEKTRDKDSGSTFYIPGLKYGGETFQYYATSPVLPPGVWYGYRSRSDYLQTNEFANISVDFTDHLTVEAGVVHFHSDFKYYYPWGGFTTDPSTLVPTTTEGSSHKWNSKAGINYKVTDHVMLYGIFSQGFRDGGSNGSIPNSCPGVPPDYVPDTLNNYELGWKTTSLNGRLVWNGATYLMNWKNLQTLIYDFTVCPPSSYNVNVGDARIYGVESNIDWKLNESWSLQASVAYTDAHITTVPDDPLFAAFKPNEGERLPYVPYFNYSANLRYEHPLGAQLRGYAQFDLAHKGDMWNDLHVDGSNGFPRMLQPAYTIVNLRFGLNPAGSRWLAELYVTNLTDKNAIIYTNTGNFDLRQTVSEPRAIGVRLNYRFGKEAGSE